MSKGRVAMVYECMQVMLNLHPQEFARDCPTSVPCFGGGDSVFGWGVCMGEKRPAIKVVVLLLLLLLLRVAAATADAAIPFLLLTLPFLIHYYCCAAAACPWWSLDACEEGGGGEGGGGGAGVGIGSGDGCCYCCCSLLVPPLFALG